MNTMIKKLLIFSLFAGVSFALPAIAMVAPKNHYFFAEYKKRFSPTQLFAKHQVGPELQSVLDATLTEWLPTREHFFGLPEYVIKEEAPMGRVLGSLLIKECSQAHNLNLVSAPTKQFYISRNYQLCAVAQKIKACKTPFTAMQVKQLYKMLKLTDYQDINVYNIVNTPEGVAYILDTEERSFEATGLELCKRLYNYDKESIEPKADKRVYLLHMHHLLSLTPDADEWLQQKIEKNEKKVALKKKGEPHE